MIRYARAMMRGADQHLRFPFIEIADFVNRHRESLWWLDGIVPKLSIPFNRNAEILAALAKARLWYGEPEIADFVNRLHTFQFHRDGDPAKTLYLAWNKSRYAGSNVRRDRLYLRAVYFIQAEINGISVWDREVSIARHDFFKWEPDWTVPPGAPKDS
jgi:hypothetical protein